MLTETSAFWLEVHLQAGHGAAAFELLLLPVGLVTVCAITGGA